MATGYRHWLILGCYLECYLEPDKASSIEHVIGDMGKRPHGDELIVIRNFNTEIEDPEGNTRNKEIAVALVDEFL